MTNPSHVYLIGVAGTGMGAFAGLLKQAGYRVSGSDTNTYPPMKDKLAQWGIEVSTPYAAHNLDCKPDKVIVGNVVSKNNVEVQEMLARNLPYQSFPQALSELFLSKCKPVVVSGTHGKTTSSSLLAHTLYGAKRNPSFLIGGIPHNFGESFRLSHLTPDTPFVVEGDEYDTAYFDKGPKFLHYRPFYLLATSLEYDHADIYQNVEAIIERFKQLFELVPREGVIVVHAGSPHLLTALKQAHVSAKVITYGTNLADIKATHVVLDESGIQFDVVMYETPKGRIQLPLAGQHNLDNALGCYAILSSIGLKHEEIAAGYASFHGVKRRLEEIGEANGILVVDDFAHHPTAVKTTIEGAKARYPARPIWALFEPRSATSCRRIFQDDYAVSFDAAAKVMLAPTGRALQSDEMLDVPLLAKTITQRGVKAKAYASIEEMVEVVKQEAPQGAVLLCMSNGGFGGIHHLLLKAIAG